MIFKNTPPDVARARLSAWQRSKELTFAADMEKLIVGAEGRGLDKRRIARVLCVMAKAMEKLGGA